VAAREQLPDSYRFLLDQNFPAPPVELSRLDATVELTHVRPFDPTLTDPRTPDWYIYLRAAEAGFHALVTRDWHQSEQPEELWVLENLQLTVVTWRGIVEDPIVEFGQLLAYVPEIKRHLRGSPRVIFVPRPQLREDNFLNPREELGKLAAQQQIAQTQIRTEARQSVEEWLREREELDRFDSWLAARRKPGSSSP
jgi:hypothetical protein